MRKLVLTLAAVGTVLVALPAGAAPVSRPDLVRVVEVEPATVAEPVVVDAEPVPEPIVIEPITPEPLEPEPVVVDPVEPIDPPEPVDPVPIPGWGGLGLEGDVHMPDRTVPGVLFSLFWDLEDPGHVQLWALWEGQPLQICDGRVIDGPVFLGRSDLLAGTCLIGQNPDGQFPLFILGDEGGWAFALLAPTDRVPAQPVG